MSEIYLIGDLHFGHVNICKERDNGKSHRDFDSIEDMHELIITNWNNNVNKNDKVYVVGDICFKRRYLSLMNELNGDKVLIKGNHDTFEAKDYLKYFRDIRASWQIERDLVITHMPIHPNDLDNGRYIGNIHAHLHSIRLSDARYFSVSAECVSYTPINYNSITKQFNSRRVSHV